MFFAPGARLGAYEVISLIGVGGMGEVYRARDTRLNRDVAIKVLPDVFSADVDRLARFKREAHVLASLNHSNIAGIHGLEETSTGTALILELVEGPTLADRIAHGPLPLDEVLPIARQIADALEAAHEHGIIHRDLKPANIKITDDGQVKVLDFGLAKAANTGSVRLQADLTASPTVTSPAMTLAGVILGTAAYMSPEQAKGKPADKRSDIWAFGCVLYEMLTGSRPFHGEDVSDTLAAILRGEPDWTKLPPSTPEPLRKLLRRSLEKDRKRRLADIADARLEIDEAVTAPRASSSAAVRELKIWQRPIPAFMVATLLMAASGLAVWSLTSSRTSTPEPVRRMSITLPDSAPYDGRGLAISPDGTRLVYAANVDGTPQLYIRALDQLEAQPLPGTQHGRFPFFSPDGEWIGFFGDGGRGNAESKLYKVSLRGGPAQFLCEAPASRGGAWSEDGTIVFGSGRAGDPHELFRISQNGGTRQGLGAPDRNQGARGWPQFLPGGTHVLFTTVRANSRRVEILALDTGESRVIVDNAYYGRYVSSGHLVYMTGSTLMAVPFNVESMTPTGPAAAIIEGIQSGVNGATSLAVASQGLLVYGRGGAAEFARINYGNVVVVGRDGSIVPLAGSKGLETWPRLSPDDAHIAVEVLTNEPETGPSGNTDIWVYDVRRGTRELFIRGDSEEGFPEWKPDGSAIAYLSTSHGGAGDLFSRPVDTRVSAETILKSETRKVANSWTPDGRTLAFYEIHQKTQRDIWTLPVGGKPQSYIVTPSNELAAAFSPDGRWVAYVSDESGERQVYVQSYPDLGRRYLISTNGGEGPVWSHNGRELFFFRHLTPQTGQLMAVDVKLAPTFSADIPRMVFEGAYPGQINGNANYDVFRDGQRFVIIHNPIASTGGDTEFVVVLNWFEELKRLSPANRQAARE